MNKLTKILLAGTIVPVLALSPSFSASAQESEPGTHTGHKDNSMKKSSHGDHAGSRDEAGTASDASSTKRNTAGKTPSTAHETSKSEPDQSPRAHKNADTAAGSSEAPHNRAVEKPSTASSKSDPTDTNPSSARAQRKAAKAGSDTATKPDTVTKTDDQGSSGARTRHEGSKSARDKTAPADSTTASDARTKPAANGSAPDAGAARNGSNATNGAATNDTRRGAPPTNTVRDNNRATPENATAHDNSRSAPDGTTPRDNNRAAPARDNAADTTRGATTRDNAATTTTQDTRTRNGDNRTFDRNGGNRGTSAAGAAAVGAAAGFAGGFIAATGAQRLDDIRRDRREVTEDGRTYIREPGRTIVTDGDRRFVVHDENERFRDLGYDVHRERQGRDYVDIIDRPGGVQIVTYTDADGRMLRRVRRDRNGREFVLIDNGVNGAIRPYQDDIVDLPPPPMRLPRDRYVVDYRNADETLLYDTLTAPPLAAPPQRYTLDQIRYSPDVRSYVRSVDINTINFDTGSWTVPGEATGRLLALAGAINRAVQRNPNSVFLVEGYTDAVGNPTDNLSLSDRRAQSVAAILTKSFNVPPENLTTQGYGQQNLKVDTQGPSVENRRVVVRNITQLIASGNQPVPQE